MLPLGFSSDISNMRYRPLICCVIVLGVEWLLVMCMFTLDNLCILYIIVWFMCACMLKASNPHLVTTRITRLIFAWS